MKKKKILVRSVLGGLAVVAGMGVNLRQTAAWFAQAGLPHAGSVLELTGRTLSLEETAAFSSGA